MKRHTFTLLLVGLIGLTCFSAAFDRPARLYYLSLTEEQVNQLAYVIDKSNAEHATVVQIQQLVFSQIEAQAKNNQTIDSLAKVQADSTKTSKPNAQPKK